MTTEKWQIRNGILNVTTKDGTDATDMAIRVDQIAAIQTTQQNGTATVDIYLEYHVISLNFDKRPFIGKNKGATMASQFTEDLQKHMAKAR